MDSFKFHDVRVEKANAAAKYRRIQTVTSLFRFVELLVFLIALSRCSTHLTSSLRLFVEYLRGVSVVSLLTPQSVFVLGNAIVIALFLISGQFSGNKAERNTDFYDEYVKKSRNNHRIITKRASAVSCDCSSEAKVMNRSHSQSANLEALPAVGGEKRRGKVLRRSVSEKSGGCGKKQEQAQAGGFAAEEMSSEEFRRTVEAFIARQQKSLREEEEFSAVVSFQA